MARNGVAGHGGVKVVRGMGRSGCWIEREEKVGMGAGTGYVGVIPLLDRMVFTDDRQGGGSDRVVVMICRRHIQEQSQGRLR